MLTVFSRNQSLAASMHAHSTHELASLFDGMVAADPDHGIKVRHALLTHDPLP